MDFQEMAIRQHAAIINLKRSKETFIRKATIASYLERLRQSILDCL